jgi:predicted O-methyltransferase YrrM
VNALSHEQPIPEIVRQVEARCHELGFDKNSRPETGRLLQTLVATVTDGAIAEFGGGCGYGTAWLLSGLRPSARLLTVENHARYAAALRDNFAGDARVEVIHGDWRELLARGPFRLAFVDVGPAKDAGADLVVASLAPGGMALLDDFTPYELWPDEWRGKPDALRERWLRDPALRAVELRVSASHAVILATKAQ